MHQGRYRLYVHARLDVTKFGSERQRLTQRWGTIGNVGDQLMRWSDDKLKSTFHRVTCPRPGLDDYLGDRYS